MFLMIRKYLIEYNFLETKSREKYIMIILKPISQNIINVFTEKLICEVGSFRKNSFVLFDWIVNSR